MNTENTTNTQQQLEAAMDRTEKALKELLGIDVTAGLSLVTGLFVGLVLELARRNGEDPEKEIRINSQGKRDITIHAKAPTFSVLNGTKVLAEDLTEDQARRLAAAEGRAGRQASILRTSGPLLGDEEAAQRQPAEPSEASLLQVLVNDLNERVRAQDLMVRDLAMTVRLLCSRLKKHEPDSALIARSMAYQQRHRLTSPLREGDGFVVRSNGDVIATGLTEAEAMAMLMDESRDGREASASGTGGTAFTDEELALLPPPPADNGRCAEG